MAFRIFTVTLILTCLSTSSFAQDQFNPLSFDQAGELRTIYQQNIIFNDLYSTSFDGGTYLGLGTNIWTRYGLRGSIRRNLNYRTAIDLGFMYNHTKFENRISQEFRPHQTFHFNYPTLENSNIQHRLRLEERIFFVDNIENRDFSARLRYRIYNKGRLTGKPVSPKSFYYRLSFEWNFNMYNELQDKLLLRGRYGIGYGYQFNAKFSLDANYFFQHDTQEESNEQVIIHIFHISFRHKIRL